MMPFTVCFVCTGNICRSPMADVITRHLLDSSFTQTADQPLAGQLVPRRVEVSSAGTGAWHVGDGADPRTVQALADAGYDGSAHRASHFDRLRIGSYDLIVALDRSHEQQLRSWAAAVNANPTIVLLRRFDPPATTDPADLTTLEVADPYHGGLADFADCLRQVEAACRGLVAHLAKGLSDSSEPALR